MSKTKLIVFAIFLFIALGYAGHIDEQTAQLQAANSVCTNLDASTVPTYEQCISNQFENNGDK